MKKAFLLLLLIGTYAADAQSLKEALFSGKLKNSPGMVIRKGDDLSQYIDTSSARKPATDENGLLKTATVKTEVPAGTTTTPATTAAVDAQKEATGSQVNTGVPADSTATTTAADAEPDTAEMAEPVIAAAPAVKEKPKDNKALFKDYMTSLASTLKSEVLSNKKIKKGSYFVMISYTIGADGQVTITDLYVDPKQELLQQQIKERLEQDPPQLNPELNSSGVARKVNRKYSFTLDKE